MSDDELLTQCEKVLRLYYEFISAAKDLDSATFEKNPLSTSNGSTLSLITLDLARAGAFEEFIRVRTTQANAFAKARAKLTPEECRLLGVTDYVATFSRETLETPATPPRGVLRKMLDELSSKTKT